MEINIQTIAQHANYMVRAQKAEDIIQKYGNNTIVLFRVGTQYEAYNDNAEQLHTHCRLPIIHSGQIAFTDFKKDSADRVFPRMIRQGFKICIMEAGTY